MFTNNNSSKEQLQQWIAAAKQRLADRSTEKMLRHGNNYSSRAASFISTYKPTNSGANCGFLDRPEFISSSNSSNQSNQPIQPKE